MSLASPKYSTLIRILLMGGIMCVSSACAKKDAHASAARKTTSDISCIGSPSFCGHKTVKVYPTT